MARPDDIVGYTYKADIYCVDHIVGKVTANPGDVDHERKAIGDHEMHLDLVARVRGIDRHDERSFDSDQFPKVIFRDSAEDYVYSEGEPERCGTCHRSLLAIADKEV